MMPGMDGIETTQKLRAMGYKGTIVALTANALTGNDEMFSQHGFNDFLSKPIDIFKLDNILKKWIPEERRNEELGRRKEEGGIRNEEMKNEESSSSIPNSSLLIPHLPGVDVKQGIEMTGGNLARYKRVLAVFHKDAEKRLALLREAPAEDSLSIFTTQVHALKSASASIGAMELSREAAMLEAAGKAGDLALIRQELPGFAAHLEELSAAIAAELGTTGETIASSSSAGTAVPVSLLIELKGALMSQKPEQIDKILEELDRQAADPALRNTLETISDQVLMTEFNEALATLEALGYSK